MPSYIFFLPGGRIPRDKKIVVPRQKTIDAAIFYISTACCGAGILLALVFLQYNLYHRKLKWVVSRRWSRFSPFLIDLGFVDFSLETFAWFCLQADLPSGLVYVVNKKADLSNENKFLALVQALDVWRFFLPSWITLYARVSGSGVDKKIYFCV